LLKPCSNDPIFSSTFSDSHLLHINIRQLTANFSKIKVVALAILKDILSKSEDGIQLFCQKSLRFSIRMLSRGVFIFFENLGLKLQIYFND
jgi:hypothetical protein